MGLLCALLVGCARSRVDLVSVDGSPTDQPGRYSLLTEDRAHPALLKAVDGVPVKMRWSLRTLAGRSFVMRAGRHVLWVKSAPYPHPAMPQRVRCYVLDVELVAGRTYILGEDAGRKVAWLRGADGREDRFVAGLVDEPWIFARDCRWE